MCQMTPTLVLAHLTLNASSKHWHYTKTLIDFQLNTINILFSENTASEQGPNLFGGLLDRCIPSPFAEVYQKPRKIHYSGAIISWKYQQH